MDMVFNATFNSYIMDVSLIDGGNQRPIMIIGCQSGNISITGLSRHHINMCIPGHNFDSCQLLPVSYLSLARGRSNVDIIVCYHCCTHLGA